MSDQQLREILNSQTSASGMLVVLLNTFDLEKKLNVLSKVALTEGLIKARQILNPPLK
jgi:hypothetical protein